MAIEYPFEFIEGFIYIDESAIPGIDIERYAVSNYGRVYDYYENKFLPLFIHDDLIYVLLRANYESAFYQLDLIVALYFCPKDEKDEVVRHIDDNLTNNFFMNLEWVRSYSARAIRGECSNGSRITDSDARLICRYLEKGEYSYEYIAMATGIDKKLKDPESCISSIYNRRTWRKISQYFNFADRSKITKYKDKE